MCQINPKHEAHFVLQAFTSDPEMTKEDFTKAVMTRVFEAEQQLNADGKFRFHIHEARPNETERLL